tara:strand:- start:4871 stop:5425 length:555 start_codon:yes stop_codon:yes gene_type:complete
MRKTNLTILLFVMLVSLAVFSRTDIEAAELGVEETSSEKVFLLSLNYDNGKVSLNEILTKTGYAPDRKLQPGDGFKGEVVSFEDRILYSFRFYVPLKVNTDVIDKGELSGGVIILSETDFALLIPYYEEAKEINLYDEKNVKVFSAKVYKPSDTRRRWLWVVVIGLVGFGIAFYLVWRKRNKNS